MIRKKNVLDFFRTCLCLLLFICPMNIMAQPAKISLSVKAVTLQQFFDEIEKKSNYKFSYRDVVLENKKDVTVSISNQPVEYILDRVLPARKLTYQVNENSILIIPATMQKPVQTGGKTPVVQVTGTVLDADGEPVIGASVAEKGATNGTVTDIEGKFSLNISENAVLRVSFIGYHNREITVGAQTNLEITLQENVQALDEVVVVGYGTQKKAHLSGAVSSISSKALANRPVSNANIALQGLAPGMNIRVANGNPLQAPSVNVRGYTSINGGEALILVDNVPMSPTEFARMNPSDIESVSILKDAASAAIYGARAAFGVVLVTTKTAKSSKLEISADVNYAYRQELNYFKYDMDLVNFMEVINLVSGDGEYTAAQIDYARKRMADPSLPEIRVPGDPTYPSLDQENRYDNYAMTDWHNLYTNHNPFTRNANVSISQRNDRMNFYTSAAYYSADGMFIEEKPLNRYNLKAGGNYKLFNWWTVGSTFTFARTEYDAPYIIGNAGESGTAPALSGSYIKNPPKNYDGTWTESGSSVMGELIDGGRYNQRQNDVKLAFSTQFDVIKDVFLIKGDANIRLYNNNVNRYQLAVPYSRSPGRIDNGHTPSAQYDAGENRFTVLNFYGDFHKTFAGKHFVQALAGFNQEHTYDESTWVRQDGLISENFPTIQLATGTINRGQGSYALSLRGVFGRLNYTFDNRYILEFNGRYDGTSRYAQGKRFGFFPSITGGWLVSNEKFFAPVRDALKVSFFKLRGSYGELGNQEIKNNYYPYFSTMSNPSITGMYLNNSRPLGIVRPGSEAAGNLSWETVRTVNFGTNLGLFNDRLFVEFDRYTRYTEGMRAPAKAIPAQFGASVAATNAADLKTSGWEFDLTWRNETKLAGSPLSYSFRFMLSDARSWITKYDNPNKVLGTYYEGQEIGEIWGFEVPGLFKSKEEADLWHDQTPIKHSERTELTAGDMKFNDLDGNRRIDYGKNTVDEPGDRYIIGNSTARLPYSFDLNGSWKGFDLRAFFQGVGKRDWYPDNQRTEGWWYYPNAYQEFWSSYLSPWRTPSIYIRDRWTEDNPNGYYPRMFHRSAQSYNTAEWTRANTYYMQDASYLRLKNLTIGYTLPEQITTKWGISRLRFYLSGENLWTLSRIHVDAIDPETIGEGYNTYPMQRVYSVGFNINF